MVQSLWKAIWQFLNKTNKELPRDLEIPLQSTCPQLETVVQTKTCIQMYIAAPHNSRKVETIQMFISWKMGEQRGISTQWNIV